MDMQKNLVVEDPEHLLQASKPKGVSKLVRHKQDNQPPKTPHPTWLYLPPPTSSVGSTIDRTTPKKKKDVESDPTEDI